jgi:putative thioredoxin
MGSEFIIDVTEADFEIQVIAYSHETPVVIDFWAEWCAPCRILGPVIEKLAIEAQGSFRLAKLNVDENPNLAKRFQIHGIPAVKVIRDGKLIAEFSGVKPEQQVRDFLRNVIPSQDDLIIEKGYSLLQTNKPIQAETAFRQALEKSPDHPGALLGLGESLLLQDRSTESLSVLQKIPASREYTKAEIIRPLAHTLIHYNEPTPELENLLEAAFSNSIYLIKRGNLEAALDGLLDILRQDKNFRDGLARKIILAIFELVGEDSATSREYRKELASVLF